AEMQTRSTFTSAGWDFTVIDGDPFDWWMLVKSYPHLYWEPYYGGGSGTAEDPYQIWTAEQMNTIGLNAPDWNKHFKLMADIDMSVYTGTQYNIIGNSDTKFTGVLNGNEHAIRNLAYTTGNAVDCIGLLGRIENAFIQNLGLENVSLSSEGKNIGGLVGWNDSSTLSACYMSGSVNGIGHVGGLVGRNDSGSLTACHAAGSVSGTNAIGGLAGGNYSGSLENCYATGSVSGTGNYVGGVIGYNTKGKLTSCYTAASVGDTGSYVGGLVGWNSTGSTVTSCFWDAQASGISTSAAGTEKTTEEMKKLSTFISEGWDFTNETVNGTNDYWRMCIDDVDYPRLNWEYTNGDYACPDGINTEDLSYYAGNWLMDNCSSDNNYCGGADLNYSGVVDLADWVIFAENWLLGI
ncbi:MAG: GLUG motif-containing protein, partial [Anaerohalosphaeraceae bacterium]